MTASIFLATTSGGVTRATSHGRDEWPVERVLGDRTVLALAADPHRPGGVLAGTRNDGVLRSDDAGRTWAASGLAGQTVTSVAVSPVDRDLIYAGTRPARLHASHDAGRTWTEMRGFRRIPLRWLWFSPASPPFSAYVQAIALSPSDPNVIVAGVEAGATVRSEDGGSSWSRHLRGSLRDCHSLTFHHTNQDWLYEAGGTGKGVSCSRDGGRSWGQPVTGVDMRYGWACAADPAQPDLWYASLSPGPGKAHSADNAQAAIVRIDGEGAERLSGGLPSPMPHMPYSLITVPEAPGHVYAGLSNGDVWHSADHGDAWAQLPFNLGGIHRTMILLNGSHD